MRRFVCFRGTLACLFLAATAVAHPLAPALLALHEDGQGRVEVRLRESRLRPSAARLQPRFDSRCRFTEVATLDDDATAATRVWQGACDSPGLAGSRIEIDGLAASPTTVVLRLALADSRVLHTVLDAGESSFTVPTHPGALVVFGTYFRLGLEHIAGGFDHLLFVAGLLLLAGRRRIVSTVSAFTLGHSATLALAALGYAVLPSGPIELAIAVSVLWLAVDLAQTSIQDTSPRRHGDTEVPGFSVPPCLRGEKSSLASDGAASSWMRRCPWLMAGSFGLLHGLGFAGALHEVGLPDLDVAPALFAFNLGIEMGQLIFVGVCLVATRFGRKLRWNVRASWRRVPIEAMGALAGYWCVDRLVALL